MFRLMKNEWKKIWIPVLLTIMYNKLRKLKIA